MGAWERIRAALRREKADAAEAVDEFQTKANAALERRERELHASPAEKFAIEQERAAEADGDLDAVRRRIEGGDTGR